MDEDSHICEHLRQELCGRWKSKTVRAALLGAVLLFLLVLVYTLHVGTARYSLRVFWGGVCVCRKGKGC